MTILNFIAYLMKIGRIILLPAFYKKVDWKESWPILVKCIFQIRSGNNNISTNISSTASTNPNCQLVTDNNVDICSEVLGNSVCNTGTAGSLITKSDAGTGTAAQKRGRNSHNSSTASTGHASRRSPHEPTPSPTRKKNLLGSTVRSLFQPRNKDRSVEIL